MTPRGANRYRTTQDLRRALLFAPVILGLAACNHADLLGQAIGDDTGQRPSAGNASGASNRGGHESGGASSAASSGDAGASGANESTAGASMLGSGGDARQGATASGTAGQTDAGSPNGDAGAAGNGSEGGSSNNGGGSAGTGGSAGAGGSGGSGGAVSACNDNDVRSCYSGPADARGKGACIEGTQTCTNGTWGACSGDVAPVTEVCNDGIDNDCDGLKDDCGKQHCVVTFDGQDASSDARPFSVARDSAMSSIVTGHFEGTVDFGGQKLTSLGYFDEFIAKYSPDCKLIWAQNFGSVKDDGGMAVKVTAGDDIIVGGYAGEMAFTGDSGTDADLGGGPIAHAGVGAASLARYDKDGKHKWSHLYGGTGPWVRDLAMAINGDIVVAGDGDGDYGGGMLGPGTVVARYTGTGNYAWSTLLQYQVGGVNTHPEAIAVDSFDTILVTGDYNGTTFSSNGSTAFLTAVSRDGKTNKLLKNVSTATKPGDDASMDFTTGYGLATKGTNIIWAGQCMAPIDFGGGKLASLGKWDAFVASYDKDGKHLFSFLDGGPNADGAHDIALDSQGNIGLIGYDYPQGIVVKYSSGGRWLWAKAIGFDGFMSNAIAADDSMATTGYFSTTIDLGNGVQTPKGFSDGFLILYDP